LQGYKAAFRTSACRVHAWHGILREKQSYYMVAFLGDEFEAWRRNRPEDECAVGR